MPETDPLERLVAAVLDSPKYRDILPDFVRRIAEQELSNYKNWKDALKAVKNKLHQVGGAYLETKPNYSKWMGEIDTLPGDPASPAVLAFAQNAMWVHASTRERMPIINQFYSQSLDKVGPVHSVLDLACGLNPLAAPWMPLTPGAVYYAVDIYPDMVALDERFLNHLGYQAKGWSADLSASPDMPAVQLALLLKILPTLEQIRKKVSRYLLEQISAEWLLVSFPARSLGGYSKGMVENYGAWFQEIVDELGWESTAYEFPGELAFLVKKGQPQPDQAGISAADLEDA